MKFGPSIIYQLVKAGEFKPSKEDFLRGSESSSWSDFKINGRTVSVRYTIVIVEGGLGNEVIAQIAVGGITSPRKLGKVLVNLPHNFLWRKFKRFVNASGVRHWGGSENPTGATYTLLPESWEEARNGTYGIAFHPHPTDYFWGIKRTHFETNWFLRQ